MHNTRLAILRFIVGCPNVEIDFAFVRCFYPKTKQPEKKLKTFLKHVQMLKRYGMIARYGGGYVATEAGREYVAKNPPKNDLQKFPRLA